MSRLIIIFVFLLCSSAWSESIPHSDQTIQESYYIWTRDDLRMCPSPYCGGFYVKALNRALTPCKDGSKNVDCKVLQLDFSLLDMTEKEQSDFQEEFMHGLCIIKGNLVQVQQDGFLYPTLVVYEIWSPQVGKASSRHLFFSIHDNGIQCVTTPCQNVDEGLINWPWNRTIAGVDLYASGADMEKIETGYQVMKTGFVIATGQHKLVFGPAGFSQELIVSEFYLTINKVETCGEKICPAGETCCNASCGICTPPGWACIQIACE
jgi:hypothetical protein